MVYTPSIDIEIFKFTVSGSKKTFTLPLRQHISADLADRMLATAAPMQAVMKAQQAGGTIDEGSFDLDQLVDMQATTRELFERYCPGAYAAATEAEINDLMAEWGRRSNIGMGESSALPSS